MKKKHVCLALFLCLLVFPLTALSRLEAEDRLARTLTGIAGGCSYDTLAALGSAVMNRIPLTSPCAVRYALTPDFPRAAASSERARKAARDVMAGKNVLPDGYTCFSRIPAPGSLRSGAFYFSPF